MNTVVIDNTRRSGNFFDNINNFNMIVNEYDISDLSEIKDIVNDDDIFYIIKNNIKTDISDKLKNKLSDTGETKFEIIKYNDNNKHKYDYITDENLKSYENPEYEKMFNEIYKSMFQLTKNEYKHYLNFCNKHKKCLKNKDINPANIESGICLEYHVNYNYEEYLPIYKIVKCYECKTEERLTDSDIELTDDNFEQSYYTHLKYSVYLDKVEFYRFMEIYKEYKEPLIITFIPTGIGEVVLVKTKEFIYDITNIDNW